jgi:hypothetical protein
MIGGFVENLLVWCPNYGFTGTHDRIVIPAKAGIQPGKPGFRIKSGIRLRRTVKLLLRHYSRVSAHCELRPRLVRVESLDRVGPVEPRAVPWPADTLRVSEMLSTEP